MSVDDLAKIVALHDNLTGMWGADLPCWIVGVRADDGDVDMAATFHNVERDIALWFAGRLMRAIGVSCGVVLAKTLPGKCAHGLTAADMAMEWEVVAGGAGAGEPAKP